MPRQYRSTDRAVLKIDTGGLAQPSRPLWVPPPLPLKAPFFFPLAVFTTRKNCRKREVAGAVIGMGVMNHDPRETLRTVKIGPELKIDLGKMPLKGPLDWTSQGL